MYPIHYLAILLCDRILKATKTVYLFTILLALETVQAVRTCLGTTPARELSRQAARCTEEQQRCPENQSESGSCEAAWENEFVSRYICCRTLLNLLWISICLLCEHVGLKCRRKSNKAVLSGAVHILLGPKIRNSVCVFTLFG